MPSISRYAAPRAHSLDQAPVLPVEVVRARVSDYCDAISRKGGDIQSVFGFIDGSKVATCRVSGWSNMQRQLYGGRKRVNCICVQALTVPDGLVAYFWGPVEGWAHESTMLRRSERREYLACNSDVFAVASCSAILRMASASRSSRHSREPLSARLSATSTHQ